MGLWPWIRPSSRWVAGCTWRATATRLPATSEAASRDCGSISVSTPSVRRCCLASAGFVCMSSPRGDAIAAPYNRLRRLPDCRFSARIVLMSQDDLATPAGTARALRAFGIRPRKRWGQHFFLSLHALEQIPAAAHVGAPVTVEEHDAGSDTLTTARARLAGRVIAVESD